MEMHFSSTFWPSIHTETKFFPEKTYDCYCIVVLYYIPASMTENVLVIYVLWQLII